MATTKKVSKKAKSKSAKKSTKSVRRAPGRVAKKTGNAFYSGERGERGLNRKQFHVLLTPEEYEKLAKLTHTRKRPAANVVRDLIMAAK